MHTVTYYVALDDEPFTHMTHLSKFDFESKRVLFTNEAIDTNGQGLGDDRGYGNGH